VLNKESSIPAEAAQTILSAAKSGVTVVVVGDAPSRSTGLRDADQQDAIVVQAMAELVQLSNVAQVASIDQVAGALLAKGRKPAASFGDSSPILSVHRKTDQGEDLWWIFNPTNDDSSVATASFATTGVPFQLDLWNGATSLVAQWSQGEGGVSLPLALPAHASTVIVFQHGGAPLHVTTTTAEDALYDNENLLVRDTHGGTKSVTLSDGAQQTVDLGNVPAPIQVGGWHLVVDEISPNGNTTHNLDLSALSDWRDIPELKDVVGSATYSASANIPAAVLTSETDVLLQVGAVAGAMQLSVNGTVVTRQTTPGGRWSVGKLLKAGTNDIVVRLDTTLLNRMAQQSSTSVFGGGSSLSSAPSGLLGPVQLIPAALKSVGRVR
jgi:hypothetical protein